MGKTWDDFKDRLGKKSAGVGMIIIDLVILLILAAFMILADIGRSWIFDHLGKGDLLTQITIIVVEVLLDLAAVAVVGSWVWEDIKRIF